MYICNTSTLICQQDMSIQSADKYSIQILVLVILKLALDSIFSSNILQESTKMNKLQKLSSVKTWIIISLATITSISYAAVAQAQSIFQTQQILSLDVLRGQPQWRQNAIQRLAGAGWQFNPNGTFIFAPANSRTDLYPLRGTFQQQGNVATFQASGSANSGTSANQAQVSGRIDFSSGQPVMIIDWATGSINAAVVNGTSFGNSPSSYYRSQLILRQVR
jgi:hypothetical protein